MKNLVCPDYLFQDDNGQAWLTSYNLILAKDDVIITDELNHASIIDGIRLSKAHRLIYKHMDMQDLQEKLKASQSNDMVVFYKANFFKHPTSLAGVQLLEKFF